MTNDADAAGTERELSESSIKQEQEREAEGEPPSKKRKVEEVHDPNAEPNLVPDPNAEPNLVDVNAEPVISESPGPVIVDGSRENADIDPAAEEKKGEDDKYANERPMERKRRLEEEARQDPKQRARLRVRLNEMKRDDIRRWLKNAVTDGEQQSDLYFRDRPLTATFQIDDEVEESPFINDPDLVEREMAPYFRAEASSLFNVNYTDVEKAIKITIDKRAWEKFLAVSKTTEKAKQAVDLCQINRSIITLVKRDPDLTNGLAHWKVATQVLKRLSLLDISNEMLKQTKVGKAINPYRKHHDPNVVELAKNLLNKWRENFKYSEKNLFGDSQPQETESQPLDSQTLERAESNEIVVDLEVGQGVTTSTTTKEEAETSLKEENTIKEDVGTMKEDVGGTIMETNGDVEEPKKEEVDTLKEENTIKEETLKKETNGDGEEPKKEEVVEEEAANVKEGPLKDEAGAPEPVKEEAGAPEQG